MLNANMVEEKRWVNTNCDWGFLTKRLGEENEVKITQLCETPDGEETYISICGEEDKVEHVLHMMWRWGYV